MTDIEFEKEQLRRTNIQIGNSIKNKIKSEAARFRKVFPDYSKIQMESLMNDFGLLAQKYIDKI